MPSLRALEEFKASFQEMGLELQTLQELELPLDDLPLPEHEAASDPAFDEAYAEELSEDLSDAEELTEDLSEGLHDEQIPYDQLNGIQFPDMDPADINPADINPADINPADVIPTGGLSEETSHLEPQAVSPETDFFVDLSDLLGGVNDLPVTESYGDEDLGEPITSSQEDIDFGNFIDTIPDDFTTPDESPTDDLGVLPDFETQDETFDAGLPSDLLNGFADEMEAEDTSAIPMDDFPMDETPDETLMDETPMDENPMDDSSFFMPESDGDSTESDAFNLGDLGLDFPMEDTTSSFEASEETGSPLDYTLPDDFSDLGDAETFAESAGESFQGTGDEDYSLPDLDDLGLGEQDQAAPSGFDYTEDAGFQDNEFPSDEFPSTEFPSDDFSSTEFPSDEFPSMGDDEAAMELAGEENDFFYERDTQGFVDDNDMEAEAELEEISGDAFDSFSPDSSSLAGEFDIGGDDFGGLDDFSIPGLDLDGRKSSAIAKRNKISREGAGEVEEISLSVEELELFMETLASYPLNLRVACEELIAEQAVAPDLMSRLVKLLIEGAPAAETAALAGKILDKTIYVPKGYEKKTGEALEEEQSSFAYIFVHNFLPVLRLFMGIALVILSAGYLCWRYIYTPIRAERIYKLGIERIDAGEYSRANERFLEAFSINPKKPWFYTYARAFSEARQYTLAEEKYQQLLNFTASKNKRNIPEKAAVLEYAAFKTYLGDYQSADSIIRRNILDYFPVDREGLLALGDNSLIWGEYESERLEDAREAYARLIERYGRTDPLLERMLKYFIRTDNLEQVLVLQGHFMSSTKRIISAATLAEMGGYFLDKRFETVRGVPNEYLDYIGGIREILLRAVQQEPMLPETYYHLARYYNYFDNFNDEKLTLEVAIRVFEAVREESPKRIGYHINSLRRYAEILIENKEFFPAEENLIKGINIYQDGLNRRLLNRSPEFGRLYSDLGDLEFFIKDGNMQNALDYYHSAEESGWAPPEIQYRMGAAHYQLRQWGPALERLFASYREMPPNRRILYALGNVSYMRGNYFAAQGYYDRLLEILDDDRSRLPLIMATDDENQLDLAERLMVAQNNLGIALEALSERTGDHRFRSRAHSLYSDSARAWDVLTRNPNTMLRMRPSPDISAPGINPAYLNIQNSLYPVSSYEPHFFLRIDKDVLEPSPWEDLAPPGYRLSEGLYSGR